MKIIGYVRISRLGSSNFHTNYYHLLKDPRNLLGFLGIPSFYRPFLQIKNRAYKWSKWILCISFSNFERFCVSINEKFLAIFRKYFLVSFSSWLVIRVSDRCWNVMWFLCAWHIDPAEVCRLDISVETCRIGIHFCDGIISIYLYPGFHKIRTKVSHLIVTSIYLMMKYPDEISGRPV